jgi:hypothetical protein
MATNESHPPGRPEWNGANSADDAAIRLINSTPVLEEALVAHPELRDEITQVLAMAMKEPDAGSVTWTLKVMQHPVFEVISRILAIDLPQKSGFGKFRDRNN